MSNKNTKSGENIPPPSTFSPGVAVGPPPGGASTVHGHGGGAVGGTVVPGRGAPLALKGSENMPTSEIDTKNKHFENILAPKKIQYTIHCIVYIVYKSRRNLSHYTKKSPHVGELDV